MDKDSLFSLEIVVDSISLQDVVCRFPAAAFKLLDFPTLIVHHVEPDLSNDIKKKIQMSSYIKLPKQFTELQNRDHGYTVRKGKSCLFRAPPSTLHTMLQSTPLYVMLMDTYPETPCLVANCTVPLNAVMDEVIKDIREMGLSIPSVHGYQDTFKLFNLMSQAVGSISIKYRILSLGMSLMPHIPKESVAELKPHTVETLPAEQFTMAPVEVIKSTAAMVTQTEPQDPLMQSADKNLQIEIFNPQSTTSCQTEQRKIGSISTQTNSFDKQRKKQVKPKPKMQNFMRENEDNFMVDNVIRPMPLFYNSDSNEKSVWPRAFEQQGANDCDAFQHYSDSDSDETIRQEDFPPEKVERLEKFQVVDSLFEPKPARKEEKKIPSPDQQGKGAIAGLNLPILNALVEEIMQLQASKLENIHLAKPNAFHPPGFKSGVVQERSASPKQQRKFEKPQPASARTPSHTSCAQGSGEVPRDKSWIRQAPSVQSYAIKKTKITPGLTNTQRLRLAKNNPQLLQTLENQEKERLQKKKAVNKKPDKMDEGKESIENGENLVFESNEAMKRPIPTPRQSKTKISIDEQSEKSNNSLKINSPTLGKVIFPKEEEKPQPDLMRTHTIIPRQASDETDSWNTDSSSPSIRQSVHMKSESDSDALFMSSLDLRRVTESYYDDLESHASSNPKTPSVMQYTPQPPDSVRSPATPRRRFTINSESVSSYVPTEDDKPTNPSPGADYSDEFEDESDEFMPVPMSMKDLRVDPLAKIGSTWHA